MKVEFVCLDLLVADTLNTVFRQGLPPPKANDSNLGEDQTVDNPLAGDDYPAVDDIQTAPPQEIVVSDSHSVAEIVAGNTEAPTEANTDQEWYEVKRVLKTKRSRG